MHWPARTIEWRPLTRHGSSWSTQDEHPHPIFDHSSTAVYFTSDHGGHGRAHGQGTPEDVTVPWIGAGPGGYDLVYSGDKAKWTQAAHTLKARIYLHLAEARGATQYASARTEAQAGISAPAPIPSGAPPACIRPRSAYG